MGKGIYVGVGGKARKVKKMYVGVETQVPIYNETSQTANISTSNIATYFTVTNGSYYFAGSGSTFTTNNGGTSNSTASTVLTALHDITALSFSYSYSSEANYDKFTLKVGGTTVENAVSGTTTTKNYSGSLAKGQKIEFTYTKDGSQNGNDDRCQFSAMSITVTIKEEVGQETKEYARKVKKAYIGVGGVARPCFSLGGVEYYGTITNLPEANTSPIGVSFGEYALFICSARKVYCYNKNLVLTNPITLTRYAGAVGFNDNYIVTTDSGSSSYSTSTEAIDKNMVLSNPSWLTTEAYNRTGAGVGQYALIGYGQGVDETTGQPVSGNTNSTVEAYSNSLVRTTLYGGSGAYKRKAACNKNYAIFGAGETGYGNMDTTPQAFGTTLTRKTCASDWSRLQYGCASTDNHVMFGGGYQQGGNYIPISYVSAYDNSLTKSTPMELSDKKRLLTGLSTPNYAMFAGGDTMGTPEESVNVDVYGLDLVRESPALSLSQGRWSAGAAMTGNYAIFAGGNDSNNRGTTVADAYLIND